MVERVNGRLKVFWGADDGNRTGSRRFCAYIGVVMVVCLGFTTLLAMTRRRDGSMGDTRLGSIALALQEAMIGQEQAEAAGPPSGQAAGAGETAAGGPGNSGTS